MVFSAFSSIKVKVDLKPVVDNLIFRLHYRYTYIIYMVSVLLCTLYDAIGNQIECMSGIDSDSFQEVVNSYCFIMGTFTVDRLHSVKVGVEVPHPGVGPPLPDDELTYHGYYQWVPFVLLIQGILFYLPHWLWKSWEGGLFKEVIQDLCIRDYLGSNLGTYFSRKDRFGTITEYLRHHTLDQRHWAWKFFFCELLNLGVVIGMLFFTDWFLGGEFLTYGSNVFEVAGLEPENRTDPMSYVFPRMAKCTFKRFGGSGTIQVLDVMCLIATNIINEKIFIFLWVWLVLLTTLTSVWMLYRFLIILLPFFRHFVLKMMVKKEVRGDIAKVIERPTQVDMGEEYGEVSLRTVKMSLSEWLFLVSLGQNMESTVFSEFIHYYASDLASGGSTDTLDIRDKKAQIS